MPEFFMGFGIGCLIAAAMLHFLISPEVQKIEKELHTALTMVEECENSHKTNCILIAVPEK